MGLSAAVVGGSAVGVSAAELADGIAVALAALVVLAAAGPWVAPRTAVVAAGAGVPRLQATTAAQTIREARVRLKRFTAGALRVLCPRPKLSAPL